MFSEYLGFLKNSPGDLLGSQGSFILLQIVKREEDFKMIAFRSLFISMAATDSLDFASRKLKKRNKNQ